MSDSIDKQLEKISVREDVLTILHKRNNKHAKRWKLDKHGYVDDEYQWIFKWSQFSNKFSWSFIGAKTNWMNDIAAYGLTYGLRNFVHAADKVFITITSKPWNKKLAEKENTHDCKLAFDVMFNVKLLKKNEHRNYDEVLKIIDEFRKDFDQPYSVTINQDGSQTINEDPPTWREW
jgi:hypothetical protein